METTSEAIVMNAEKTPYGKLMGIVESREQLQAVSEALSKLGVHNVETLDGAVGIECLAAEKEGPSGIIVDLLEFSAKEN